MRLVLATDGFCHIGGSETYLLTLAEQLQRLGHDVVIHAVKTGAVSELAVRRGLPVLAGEAGLPAECDGTVVQDVGVAHALAARYPGTAQLFVAHSDLHDFQLPTAVTGAPAKVVVLSDRVARRVAATAPGHDVVRLRQPIDTERLIPLGAVSERPRRALLLGNHQQSWHRRLLHEVWEPLGIELRIVGSGTAAVVDPLEEIAAVDFVVGKGRAILDAMACGRPAYVYDDFGTDGWVSAGPYPELEADGFAGQATPRVADRARLAADLEAYDPAMGAANRELVLMHHKARNHAHEVVELLRGLTGGRPRPAAPAPPNGELALAGRLRWAADDELRHLRLRLGELHGRLREAEERAERAERAEALAQEAVAREQEAAAAARVSLEAILAQRRIRLGRALGRSADRVRRVVRR